MPRRVDLHRQRGAVSLLAGVLIATVAVGALVSIDVGFVFYSQRQLQKSVDLAALSGAQQLKRADDLPTTTANVMASVTAAASQNGYPRAVNPDCGDVAAGAADGMRTCLGVWDPSDAVNGDGVRHFNAAYNTATLSPNAVRVQASLTVPLLFVLPGGTSRQLHAEAIAAGSPPVASFSLGSGLLDLNTASGMLGLLLGNTVNLSVADWNGLANANVTLEQLRLQLGAGTVDQLLNTTLSIQDFYALVLNAAGRQALLGAALGSPATQLGLNGIGTRLNLAQMLDVGVLTPAASSAAEVGLNVASLLTTAAYVARGTSAVALNVPGLNLATPLGNTKAVASLTVIDPPRVAVGPARQLANGTWRTTATTAQVGLNLVVQSKLNVLGLVSADVNLPVLVRAAQATGNLTALQCAATPAQRRATINVSTRLLNACLSQNGRECVPPGSYALATLSLLSGLGTARLMSNPVAPNAALNAGSDFVLAPGDKASTSSPVAIQQTVDNLATSLRPSFDLDLFKSLGLSLQPGDLLADVLAPVGTLLGTVLNWLLATLGIDIANATVWLNGVDCNNAELVY
jgi:uncharacterized membrane protein